MHETPLHILKVTHWTGVRDKTADVDKKKRWRISIFDAIDFFIALGTMLGLGTSSMQRSCRKHCYKNRSKKDDYCCIQHSQ